MNLVGRVIALDAAGRTLHVRIEGLPEEIRAIAWKAQVRLCARYRRMAATRKTKVVITTAIAREMVGFLWANRQEGRRGIHACSRLRAPNAPVSLGGMLSDLKLFRITGVQSVVEVASTAVALERSLQTLIERNLFSFLGVQFLASEYSTGPRHGGRIDTLGLDENGAPVIIEYKRATNENVINQGLFYLDWLMDHKAEFKPLVMDKLGREPADAIDWTAPRLLCIAGDFTRYDEHSVQQINRNIELLRYRRYGEELLLLELVNRKTAEVIAEEQGTLSPARRTSGRDKTVTDYLEQANQELRDRYEALKAYLLALGDDVQFKVLKNYFAFRRLKNFACVEVHNRSGVLLVYLKVDPDEVNLQELQGLARDVREIGHFGTGDLELTIRTAVDLERVKPFLEKTTRRRKASRSRDALDPPMVVGFRVPWSCILEEATPRANPNFRNGFREILSYCNQIPVFRTSKCRHACLPSVLEYHANSISIAPASQDLGENGYPFHPSTSG